MLDALDITEAEAAGLSELAAGDLATARHFGERARAAEDPDVANSLARTAQRAARSYRQILLLKARLRRELADQALNYPKPRDARAVSRRMDEVRSAVARIACADLESYDGPDNERAELLEDVMSYLTRQVLTRSGETKFETDPLDKVVTEIACELGLPIALIQSWRELPDAPPPAPADSDDAPPWRGSG